MPRDPEIRRALRRGAVVTAVLLALVVLRIPYLLLAFRFWLVALGAIALVFLVSRSLAGWPVGDGPRLRLPWGWWRRAPRRRVRQLEELEHTVGFSASTAFDAHYRLRPILTRIADHRLALRGTGLRASPQRAQQLLGAEAWELIRPDRAEPADRTAPGLDLPRLGRILDRLDGI